MKMNMMNDDDKHSYNYAISVLLCYVNKTPNITCTLEAQNKKVIHSWYNTIHECIKYTT